MLAKMGDIGARYGRLVVLAYGRHEAKNGHSMITCLCDCGAQKNIWAHLLTAGVTQSCGCLHKEMMQGRVGDKHANWKGGRSIHEGGYVLIKKRSHPNAQIDGYIFEHIFIMSEFLGRPLRENENVHHRNGFKDDNRLDNLELWTIHQPPGQRVEDVFAWCQAYIVRYEADLRKLQQVRPLRDMQEQLPLDAAPV